MSMLSYTYRGGDRDKLQEELDDWKEKLELAQYLHDVFTSWPEKDWTVSEVPCRWGKVLKLSTTLKDTWFVLERDDALAPYKGVYDYPVIEAEEHGCICQPDLCGDIADKLTDFAKYSK